MWAYLHVLPNVQMSCVVGWQKAGSPEKSVVYFVSISFPWRVMLKR